MPKLTSMMIVRNEANGFLYDCLKALSNYVDEIVILDDASTDETPDICLSFPIVKLYNQKKALFLIDEAQLRHQLWTYTTASNPEWILAIDADEFIEEKIKYELPYLMNQAYYTAISFRLFDCWKSEDYYRIDGLWNPWTRGFSTYMVKYQHQLNSTWPSLKFHCGRFPLAYRQLPHYESSVRIKHLGWANPLNILSKYERAISQDPTYKYMSQEHYESILYPRKKIQIRKWEEHSYY